MIVSITWLRSLFTRTYRLFLSYSMKGEVNRLLFYLQNSIDIKAILIGMNPVIDSILSAFLVIATYTFYQQL